MSIVSCLSRPMRIAGLALLLSLGALSATRAANAQSTLNLLGGFFTLGGYYPAASSGVNAIGTPKFFDEGAYYTRPRSMGEFQIAGGIETMDARDHFFPFTGGNEFSLIGLSATLSTKHTKKGIFPFVSAGYFVAYLRSENLSISTTTLVPSMSFGIVVPIYKSIKLTASYRLTPDISGVNTNGFGISLRLF